jgi:hypothetical protein
MRRSFPAVARDRHYVWRLRAPSAAIRRKLRYGAKGYVQPSPGSAAAMAALGSTARARNMPPPRSRRTSAWRGPPPGSFQRSRHVRPTSSSRVRFRAAEVTRILSQSGAYRRAIARSAGVGTSIQTDQARPSRKQNPAGGAPRRGDCGPYAEGRVYLRSGQTGAIMSPKGMAVSPIRDSGTQNSYGVLNLLTPKGRHGDSLAGVSVAGGRARTRCGSCAGCPAPGSGAARRERPRAGR